MITTNIKYIAWLNAEDMHTNSLSWLSELNFIKDEQHFFEELIRSNTFELIDAKYFSKNIEIINQLSKMIDNNELIINEITIHENNLKIMVDGVDQLVEEKEYKNQHRKLSHQLKDHLTVYKKIKSELFDTIKKILKSKKQQKHLNP